MLPLRVEGGVFEGGDKLSVWIKCSTLVTRGRSYYSLVTRGRSYYSLVTIGYQGKKLLLSNQQVRRRNTIRQGRMNRLGGHYLGGWYSVMGTSPTSLKKRLPDWKWSIRRGQLRESEGARRCMLSLQCRKGNQRKVFV